jgi:hypothetical protein
MPTEEQVREHLQKYPWLRRELGMTKESRIDRIIAILRKDFFTQVFCCFGLYKLLFHFQGFHDVRTLFIIVVVTVVWEYVRGKS